MTHSYCERSPTYDNF